MNPFKKFYINVFQRDKYRHQLMNAYSAKTLTKIGDIELYYETWSTNLYTHITTQFQFVNVQATSKDGQIVAKLKLHALDWLISYLHALEHNQLNEFDADEFVCQYGGNANHYSKQSILFKKNSISIPTGEGVNGQTTEFEFDAVKMLHWLEKSILDGESIFTNTAMSNTSIASKYNLSLDFQSSQLPFQVSQQVA